MDATARVKSVSLDAKVIRADGSERNLGTVAYYHRNPIRRLVARLRGQGRVSVKR